MHQTYYRIQGVVFPGDSQYRVHLKDFNVFQMGKNSFTAQVAFSGLYRKKCNKYKIMLPVTRTVLCETRTHTQRSSNMDTYKEKHVETVISCTVYHSSLLMTFYSQQPSVIFLQVANLHLFPLPA